MQNIQIDNQSIKNSQHNQSQGCSCSREEATDSLTEKMSRSERRTGSSHSQKQYARERERVSGLEE
jgi:hypothetical protein